MMKRVGVILIFSMLLFFPNLAASDCADFGRMTGFKVQDNETITFYNQNSPIAQVKLQNCTVDSSSNIRLMKSYVCNGDRVIVDGQECAIMTLTLSSAQ